MLRIVILIVILFLLLKSRVSGKVFFFVIGFCSCISIVCRFFGLSVMFLFGVIVIFFVGFMEFIFLVLVFVL